MHACGATHSVHAQVYTEVVVSVVGVLNIWPTPQTEELLFVGQRRRSFLSDVKEGYAAVLYKGVIMNHTQLFNPYLMTIKQH